MATEEGIVINVGPTTARIKTTRSGACESCASRGACSTIGGGREMEVEALNPIGARVDDCVVINFESSALLKISFLLYIFPILCMMAGALIGHWGFGSSGASALLAVLFFILAFLFIKFRSNKLAQKDVYRPKIVRILKRA